MFGLFKKKSPVEKLQEQYEKLISEAHKLSTVDRKASDLKAQEADEILKKIDALQESN
ncbi:MAG: Lacal_2735 family protein [Bacteroidota bacterium]